jgi:hypothetical protein
MPTKSFVINLIGAIIVAFTLIVNLRRAGGRFAAQAGTSMSTGISPADTAQQALDQDSRRAPPSLCFATN